MLLSELSLSPTVLRAVEESGYTESTPIQEQAIPPALAGRDILGIAQTGTGKTAAYGLPTITLLAQGRARARMPRSVILCPTRELAQQVAESLRNYSKHDRLVLALIIGGVSVDQQIRNLDRGADILIATPGRLLDLFERGRVMLGGVQIAIVDEADRMLDMGFIPDLEKIFRLLPFTRQTMLFSATMPPDIARLADEFLQNPVRVEVAPPATTVERVQQTVVHIDRRPDSRVRALLHLIDQYGDALTNGIVFCNRKRTVSDLFVALKRKDLNVAALHGDLDQHTRTTTLNNFRNDTVRFLIASDVAARGLDIPLVSHVFNFDVPVSPDDYVHRIGRTARAGRPGVAVTLCDAAEVEHLRRIEKHIQHRLEELEPTAGTERQREARSGPPVRRRDAEDDATPARSRRRGTTDSRRTRDTTRTRDSEAPRSSPPRRAADERDEMPDRERRSDPPRRREPRAPRPTAPERADDSDTDSFLPTFLTTPIPVKSTSDDNG